jgi:phage terminase large subunit
VNEANGVPYPIYQQLEMRTRKNVYIDYNPSERFWVHDHVIGSKGAKLIISDHRGNMFLSEAEHERIEGIQDPELHKVYARGKTGKLSGLVFPNFNVVDEMPEDDAWRMSVYGMDWGFSNDPTALVHVVLAHGELWLNELIYETDMTNPDIAKRCHGLGLGKRDKIVADASEPKSIKELKNLGLWVVPSVKGADSINAGIDTIRRYPINVTRHSRNIIKEMGIYKYKVDRDGKTTNTLIDKFNHAMYAVRYVGTDILTTRRTGAARATTTRLY